jgi:DNA/RNA-binding domain of Phe-tRNA-synthetase-like protein
MTDTEMNLFTTTQSWHNTYPEACAGILAMQNVTNPQSHPILDQKKEELEESLRLKFKDLDRPSLRSLPVLQAYKAYYRQFKKTYHVQLQLESLVFKKKSIPHVATLVEAMFMAELEDLLLTAGHDLGTIQRPLEIAVARGDEQYIRLNGQEQQLKAGDMFIADRQGVISSILYGPDQRTRITSQTKQVIFTVYAPPGIGITPVQRHLDRIQENVQLIAPTAETILNRVYCSQGDPSTSPTT